MNRVDPCEIFDSDLLSVEKPARYLGGEAGSVPPLRADEPDGTFLIALCFPDLYEIGMSNTAIRILYSALNALPGVRCERVFTPAQDYERLLASRDIPLHTLESGIPLSCVDMLAFSIGYELCASNIITVLDSGRISHRVSERRAHEPVVIAGGPVVSNPLPFSTFIDAFWIGEAEARFFDLVRELADMKKNGQGGRLAFLSRIAMEKAVWMPGKNAVRAVYEGFSSKVYETGKPFANVKPVQDHGVVEIMRGCPNACRFCHAGFYYRPQRCKSFTAIIEELDNLVLRCGYQQITLSSLSSGDYPDIVGLLSYIGKRYEGKSVSFQLPSLKIESLSLDVISLVSEVRRSGLTFAVETPTELWQMAINKSVTINRTLEIIREARRLGYRIMKFYFMIGLPVSASAQEQSSAICDFMEGIARSNPGFQINISIGTFVPKPHTPFQWAGQLSEQESHDSIHRIKERLKIHRNVKVSYHSPFLSLLEGVISRGDERVGELLLSAWEEGARLDAWDEHFNAALWRKILENPRFPFIQEILDSKDERMPLPWDEVSIRVSKRFLLDEYRKAETLTQSEACTGDCVDRCGSCSDSIGIEKKTIQVFPAYPGEPTNQATAVVPAVKKPKYRLLLRFTKTGKAAYIAHHSVADSFHRAFSILSAPVCMSEGFNPLPRLDLGNPVPLGMESEAEYGIAMLYDDIDPVRFPESINEVLPEGICIQELVLLDYPQNTRIVSLAVAAWGAVYILKLKDAFSADSFIPAFNEAKSLYPESMDSNAALKDTGIEIRACNTGKKESSLKTILEKASMAAFSSSAKECILKIRRIGQLAHDGSSKVELISYFKTRGY